MRVPLLHKRNYQHCDHQNHQHHSHAHIHENHQDQHQDQHHVLHYSHYIQDADGLYHTRYDRLQWWNQHDPNEFAVRPSGSAEDLDDGGSL